jgi:hypothetical protein
MTQATSQRGHAAWFQSLSAKIKLGNSASRLREAKNA